jgi:hypothetical protein
MNTQKQWITTNMRFPTDLYMALKMEALNKKMSVTSLIHSKLFKKKVSNRTRNVDKIMSNLARLAKETSKQNPGISFSEKLIEMRCEQ